MSIGNWYRVGTVAVTNGSVNIVGTGTFWLSQCNPGDRFTVDQENWYEIQTITDDTHMAILGVGGSGAYTGSTASNIAYAVDRNFNNALSGGLAASVASLLAQYQANSNGPLSGLFGNGAVATPGIAFLNEASTGLYHPSAGIAALAVQGAEFLRAVGTAAGVPAMLGIGTTAPANAVDLLTSKNALFGARIQNSSAGAAARAALQIGNTTAAAQALNVGVNGASFTASGVLAPSRGFVEGPNGVDFASGVTSGIAFSWGVGASYASKMSMDFDGCLSIVSGGKLGIGMTPANVLDITQSQNIASVISLLNPSTGGTAQSVLTLANGTSLFNVGLLGSGFTTSGIFRQNGGYLNAAGAGGLTLATTVVQPVYIGVNNAEVARFVSSGMGVGVTPSAWGAGNTAIDVGGAGSFMANANGPFVVDNAYFSSGWIAKTTGASGYYSLNNGVHQWATAGSATAGSAVTMATTMQLDIAGDLLVGAASGTCHTISKAVTNETGSPVLNVLGATGFSSLVSYGVTGGGVSGSNAANKMNKDATTGYSLRMAGVLGASGADYAEYRELIPPLYGAVAKGALLGYDASGLMTNVFADVVGRVLPKSTNPSYVGGDTWGTQQAICAAHGVEAPGEAPSLVHEPATTAVVANPGQDASEEERAAYAAYLAAAAIYPDLVAAYCEYQIADAAYQTRLTTFNAALEIERQKYDRIALCGVVPVNITGLTAGDIGKHLVPSAAADGTITAVAVAKNDLTLCQYIDSFGTIEKIGDDGRPLVNVKNG